MACDRLRPIVLRAVEGEATPEEALRAARHVAECTGCRIVAAREKRLAETLSDLPDRVAVDDGFVHRVMAALAPVRVKAPGASAALREARKRLRVVGRRTTSWLLPAALLGGWLAHGLSGSQGLPEAWRGAWPTSPDAGALPLDLLATMAAAITGVAERSDSGLSLAVPFPELPAVVTASTLLLGAGLVALAVALHGLRWPASKRFRARRTLEAAFRGGAS